MKHLSFDKILSYSENQLEDKEIHEIEMHLATCRRCHEIFMGLKSVAIYMGKSFREERATSPCPEDWEIAALVKKDLLPEISDRITDHIKDCGFCLDRAANYYRALQDEEAPVEAPAIWKQKAVETIKAVQTRQESRTSLLQRLLLTFLPDFSSPFHVATGIAAALLAIAVVAWIVIPDKSKITTSLSNEKIVIRDSEIPNTFGFTGAGETVEVKNMDISLNGREIIFKWQPIEGASEYEFLLKDEDRAVYKTRVGKETSVSLSIDLIEDDRPYKWTITGKTADNRYFEYTGDLIFVK